MAATKKSRAALKKALAADDISEALANVRELIPDEGEGPQEVVVYCYACILEVNSAGLSILFDRFDDAELTKCDAAIEAIGAAQTLAAFRTLHARFSGALASGKDRLQASEWLNDQPDARRINREFEALSSELEQHLLDYCNRHVEEIARGLDR